MKIEYLHASKYGNGAKVAAEFKQQMAGQARRCRRSSHSEGSGRRSCRRQTSTWFSSPGRFGKPIGGMRRFLKKVELPAGTPYAILTTEAAPKPDKKTGRTPTEEELAKWQRVRPVMNEILQGKGLAKVAEDKVFVTGLIGPLEEGWRQKVEAFAMRITDIAADQSSASSADVEAT
jgi:hypothetical protein